MRVDTEHARLCGRLWMDTGPGWRRLMAGFHRLGVLAFQARDECLCELMFEHTGAQRPLDILPLRDREKRTAVLDDLLHGRYCGRAD
jgi:hypothetical protein